MGSQLDPLPFFRVESRERATKSQFLQLDFVKPSSGFHPVTWERVNFDGAYDWKVVNAWLAEMEDYLHAAKVRRHSAMELA